MTVKVIKDVQSGSDTRAVPINRVGIRALRLPLVFTEGAAVYPTIGEWDIATNLSAEQRGTHMSRLVRILHESVDEKFNYAHFCRLPAALLKRLEATEYFISVQFTHFIKKTAPVSGEKGLLDTTVRFIASRVLDNEYGLLQVVVPVTSLCPCSKAISQYGAHNQRSHITLTVEPKTELFVRDLIAVAEQHGASSELFSVLKRSDERHVTEKAYDNPKFVEDIVRDLGVALTRFGEINSYRAEAENFESIHNHSAYAIIETDNFPDFLL